MCLNSDLAAENSSSTCSMCESIEPPMSKNTSTLTALRRSGGMWTSRSPWCGVAWMVVAAQRDLDVADAELDIAVEILEFAAVPHLHRAKVAVLLLADADAFGVVTMGAERRGTAGADPLVAALVAALLFFQPLAQGFHELVPAHRLDLLLLFLGEVFLGELLQPFGGDVRLLHGIEQAFQPLEYRPEYAVELVEIAL